MITTDLSTQLCVYQLEMEFSGTYWFNTRHIYIVSIKMSSRNEWVNRGQDAHYLILNFIRMFLYTLYKYKNNLRPVFTIKTHFYLDIININMI